MKVPSASCGLSFNCPDDIEAKLTVVTASGYDFMAIPIVHPRYRLPEVTKAQSLLVPDGSKQVLERKCPFARSDLILTSGDWSSLVVGVISRDLNLESQLQDVRRAAEARLQRELQYCLHLGTSNDIL